MSKNTLLHAIWAVVLSGCNPEPVAGTRLPLPAAEVQPAISDLEERTGVRLHVTYQRDNFFPPSLRRPPGRAQGSPLEQSDQKPAVAVVSDFLAMYPPQLIADNLRDIYLLRTMTIYGPGLRGNLLR